MEDNPYAVFVQSMRQEAKRVNGPGFRLGQVVSPAPLRVRCGSIVLSGEDLLVNAMLKPEYSRQIEIKELSGSFTANCLCPDSASGARTISSGSLQGQGIAKDEALKAGDQVVMLAMDGDQRFIILCKVVAA